MPKQITTPLPEVVDRYTIARLKLERLDETQIDIESMKELRQLRCLVVNMM